MINSLLHNESHLQHLILITVRDLYPKLDQPDEWDPTKLALVSLQSLTYEELDNMNTIIHLIKASSIKLKRIEALISSLPHQPSINTQHIINNIIKEEHHLSSRINLRSLASLSNLTTINHILEKIRNISHLSITIRIHAPANQMQNSTRPIAHLGPDETHSDKSYRTQPYL